MPTQRPFDPARVGSNAGLGPIPVAHSLLHIHLTVHVYTQMMALAESLQHLRSESQGERVEISGQVTSGACGVEDFAFNLVGACTDDDDCDLGRICVVTPDILVDGNPAICRSNARSPDCQRLCGLPISIDGNSRFNIERSFEDGQRSLEYLVRDLAGNETLGEYTFRVDSTPPSISQLSPAADSFTTAQQVEVQAFLEDGGSGVVRATINGNNAQLEPAGAGFEISRFVFLNEGANEIVITATDYVGNTSEETYEVRRDRTPPEVTVISPADGSEIVFPLLVTGTVDDGETGYGGERVQVNGVEALVDLETREWVASDVSVDLETLSISVVGLDGLGNESEPVELSVLARPFGHRDPEIDGLTGVGFVDGFQ